jgi:ACS family hexuronate transporter-like MFS transporter
LPAVLELERNRRIAIARYGRLVGFMRQREPLGFRIIGLRWWIAVLLLVATLISYIDRLTLSVLAPVICDTLRLTNLQYASVSVWFLLAYSLGQTLFGALQDVLGTKRGLSIAMAIWSLAEAAQAAVSGLNGLRTLRFFLGLGEGGHWPAAIKGIAEWFPREERALGIGIINTGATLGSALAPPLIVWMQMSFGWRFTFVATGILGFVWLGVWALCYQIPTQHRWLSDGELKWIESNSAGLAGTTRLAGWLSLLRDRRVLGIVLARFLGDPVWWFFLVWLPLYLYRARGMSLKSIGLSAWVPFLLADAGALSGGWFSGWLIRRGSKPAHARGIAIALATLLAPCGILIGAVRSELAAIALISIVLFAFQFWVNNVQTLPSDFFPSEAVASVSGLAGTGAGIGAMIFTFSTGWIVDRFGYSAVLVCSGFLVPAASAALVFFCKTPASLQDAQPLSFTSRPGT